MILGRMIYFFVDDKKLVGISAIRLAALFVTLDILAFIVQASGGSMASMDDAPDHILKIGLDVYMGGVGLQEMFILGFTALAVLLHRRMIQTESTQLGWEARTPRQGMPWRWMFYAMYATLVLISVCLIPLVM